MSEHTGEYSLEMGGKKYTLKFGWKAISELTSTYGEDALENLTLGNVDVLANVLVIGLKKHHPEITIEKIFDEDPPVLFAAEAVQKALMHAFYGNKAPNNIEMPKVEGKSSKKKT